MRPSVEAIRGPAEGRAAKTRPHCPRDELLNLVPGGFFRLNGRHFQARNLPASPLHQGLEGFRTEWHNDDFADLGRAGKEGVRGESHRGSRLSVWFVRCTSFGDQYEWGKHHMRKN